MSLETAIIIPARYGSTRFPGKPLALLGGESMVVRTARNAEKAAEQIGNCVALVATDDDRILRHCEDNNIRCIMTERGVPSGSDRALQAVQAFEMKFKAEINIIINLQGDAPFTPPGHVLAVYELLKECSDFDVATPYIKLSWDALDRLRSNKELTPFSGTTLIATENKRALWFSKNIIPAMRKESDLRKANPLSPVCRHIGLYAFRRTALEKFVSLPVGRWENLEGLEQLRCLENDMVIGCTEVQPANIAISGIDTPEDLCRAEALLAANKT